MKKYEKQKAAAKKLKENCLEILYPRRCPVCHKIAAPRGQKICLSCRDKLKPAQGPRCFCCSKPLREEEREYCGDCSSKSRLFEQGIGIFLYSSVLQESLFKLKYEKRQEYGAFYGEIAAFYGKEQIRKWNPDFLIPVPLHRKRREKRGYNQAELIGEALGETLGLPVRPKALKRVINTRPQKELDPGERRRNVKNAFRASEEVKGKRILLVDDIYTTGSTVEAASEALKKAGAEKVYFLSIAIGADT